MKISMKIYSKVVLCGFLAMSGFACGVTRYAKLDDVMTEVPELKTYITNATNRPIAVRQVRADMDSLGKKWLGITTQATEVQKAPSQSFKEELINAHVIQPGETIDLYMAGGKYNDFLMGYADEESGNALKLGKQWDKGFITSDSTAAHWAQGHRSHWLVIFGCKNVRALDLLKGQYAAHNILLKGGSTPGRVQVQCNSLEKLNAAVFDCRKKSISQVKREVSDFITDLKSAQHSVGE